MGKTETVFSGKLGSPKDTNLKYLYEMDPACKGNKISLPCGSSTEGDGKSPRS
jgi:hypothetical protein